MGPIHRRGWPLPNLQARGAFFGVRMGTPNAWRYCVVVAQRWEIVEAHGSLTFVDASDQINAMRKRDALPQAGTNLDWSPWAYYPQTGIHVHSPKTVQMIANETVKETRRVNHEDFLHHVHPEDRKMLDRTLNQAQRTRSGYRLE